MAATVAAALAATLAAAPGVLAHGAPGVPPPTDPLSIATAWIFDPLPIIAIVASTALYLAAVRRVDGRHPGNPWPRRRTGWKPWPDTWEFPSPCSTCNRNSPGRC